jgi:ABC-type bacteriocin/lantibiotic exporter with double-glycine peptidase domain
VLTKFHDGGDRIIQRSTTLFQNATNIEIIKTILERINDIYDSKLEYINEKGVNIEQIDRIEFNNIGLKYSTSSNEVLKFISFTVSKGERIALVGPSGSGKSTILKLIASLYKPNYGKIIINGINMKDININSLRNEICFVPQNFALLEDTILNNMTFEKEVSKTELQKVLIKSGLENDIENFPLGLNTKISSLTSNLSGGQKQRIAIARAILNGGSLLLLDEATASLDYLTERKIVESLKNLIPTQIIIAHRLSTIISVDRIYYMEKGQILEFGNHNELMKKKGKYFGMYNSQLEGKI